MCVVGEREGERERERERVCACVCVEMSERVIKGVCETERVCGACEKKTDR